MSDNELDQIIDDAVQHDHHCPDSYLQLFRYDLG